MMQARAQIKINMDSGSHEMNIGYIPKTDRTVFDICDINGRVIKTGQIRSERTTIALEDLENDNYILLILDGDRVTSCKFSVAR
jgi:hypothetical protein